MNKGLSSGRRLALPECMPLLRPQLSPVDIQLYRGAEIISGALISCMVIFSPWAFGTTQTWSIWTMNAAGYALGLLLALKVSIRVLKSYRPERWDSPAAEEVNESRHLRRLTRALAVLTGLILLYTFTSAINTRATWLPFQLRFEYYRFIPWLPHSMDGAATWSAAWKYLGLACAFWAIRDWLLAKSGSEQRIQRHASISLASAPPIPARLRGLLWLLAINGALLAIEGIIQRGEGSGKLLFLVKPHVNPGAETQFGPWAYRSNASQYFNLLWPVCLGFWWTLHRAGGSRRKRHHLILVCAALMAACPIISTSRGGAIVTVAIAVLGTGFLLAAQFVFGRSRAETPASRGIAAAGIMLFLISALALGLSLGWKTLQPRMADLDQGYDQREEMYERARPMAADYPLFGTGPGTFSTVFQLYRITTDTYWPAQLHNDWLETRITFGWLGSILVALSLALAIARWFIRGGIHGGRRFMVLTWMAMAGCMVHARWDLPFQIHSIVFLFLVICAILSILSRRVKPKA